MSGPHSLDPLEALIRLGKRLDKLDQARSSADCLAGARDVLQGLVPYTAARLYLHDPVRRTFEPVGDADANTVGPTLLNWTATTGEVTTLPAADGGSLILVPIPGQIKTAGVLALDSREEAGSLNRATVLMLDLLARELGRVLEGLDTYEQMQRLRELLDNIVESVPHGILAVGPDDTVISCNRNSEILFGIHRIDVLGERYQAALPKPLADRLSTLMVEVLKDQTTHDVEFEHALSPTQALTVGISASLLRDKQGAPQGLLFICRDMSLSMEVQKLRELDRMKSEFVHTVSHELKTPLTAVMGGCEVLQADRDAFTPEQQEIVDIIDQGGKRLHALITDLLDLARLESGRAGIEREETDLGPLIAEAVENVRHKNPKCSLVVDVPEDFPRIMADPDKLKQVFENLIGNALKYSPEGGEVRVRLAREGDKVRFAVSDRGIGIAPEHIPQLFEKFYRVDSSTTSSIEGTGLGLTIVKHIIDLHEGEVTVESVLRKGSTFGFVIPLIIPST